jgi:hypothetical protein
MIWKKQKEMHMTALSLKENLICHHWVVSAASQSLTLQVSHIVLVSLYTLIFEKVAAGHDNPVATSSISANSHKK